MKAAYIKETGSSKNIIIGDLPEPEIGADDVLVKVSAVSVNHVDTFVRAGSYQTNLNFPFVIGRDAVGEVEKVGANVDRFAIGSQVWTNSMGYDGRQGTTSRYVAVPADRLFHIPSGVDPIKLVASVHSSATAAILINHVFQAKSGDTILVEGAAGHVGTKLIQLAHTMGLRVITTSNEADFDKMDRFGSDLALDYKKSLTKQLEKHNIDGVDFVVDTSGKVALQENINALNERGTIGLITAPEDNKFTFNVRKFYTTDKAIRGFVLSHATIDQFIDAAKLLNQRMVDGFLLDDDIVEKPIEDAAQAQHALETNTVKERLVLKF
ncbi:L-threonine 3-dehydrogenase [Lentilactobacillus hilgardii]|uniref:NADPH:quinone reductase n=1 Tax=Lentilactobacillus hilgardii TaxID=1588 RepID=UPI00019C463F|nr:NADPH:quinone reductase [Lentilactobacillus hilgardii]EEI20026.1 GroES-like protein [Lentilactobacillus buchneri ATCC 11577]MCT3397214.1 NADPH:quinone reductase [Lentilactobacillus hilgardii]QIR08938.1 L-threonine 3-dehydrogenase [Lentilactobacillus hilgardii]